MQDEVGLGGFLTGLEGTFGVRCRYLVAASLEVPPLCSCEAMFHLLGLVGILPFFLGSLWGQSGGCSVEAALSAEPNRLNARKRLLVLLAVDGVSFVISCCKASKSKSLKKKKKKKMFSDTPKWLTRKKMVKTGEVTKWCVRKQSPWHLYHKKSHFPLTPYSVSAVSEKP